MFLVVVAMLSVPVLLLGKPLYLYWLFRGGKGLRRRRVSLRKMIPPQCDVCVWYREMFLHDSFVSKSNVVASPQGYERVRRVSEEDSSTAPPYEDDEEEGLDEVTGSEALPKQVRHLSCVLNVAL